MYRMQMTLSLGGAKPRYDASVAGSKSRSWFLSPPSYYGVLVIIVKINSGEAQSWSGVLGVVHRGHG
eukprot:2813790-Rhodomonas_salina.1